MSEKSRYQQLCDEAAREIDSRIDSGFGHAVAPIRLAGAIGRAKLAAGLAPLSYYADAHREATYCAAAEELERIIDLYEMGQCNPSQKRIAVAVLDDTSCVKSILASAFESPAIEKYWRHHTKHHGDKPLSATTNGMLRKLVADHYRQIPGIEDLQGKGGMAR